MQIKGFHATNHDLSKLDYSKLLQSIGNHKNGALGLWCAIKSDWIGGFGNRTYGVSIEGKDYSMPYAELVSYSQTYQDVEQYTAKRNELMQQGYDFIRLIESKGHCDMFIVLSFEKAVVTLLK